MKRSELVGEWIRRFNAVDIDGLATLYAIDVVNHQVVTEPLIGREAIHHMFSIEFGARRWFAGKRICSNPVTGPRKVR